MVLEGIIDCAKKCLANNIPVGLGTDTGCPYITHYDMYRELYYFVKYCKVSNKLALYTATAKNAELLGAGDICGKVKKGYYADLIVCAENPLDNILALKNIEKVICRGELVNNKKLKKYSENEGILNKYL